MRILVTAGPTREYLDPVRFLSNASTGTMGYALARAARDAGHQVTLISGPTATRPPGGISFVPVISARDMYRAVSQHFNRVDVVLMNAAVSDYRPRRRRVRKIKKSGARFMLELVPNLDILKALGRRKKHQRLMGFALETHHGLAHARQKLREKRLDWIVLNSPSAIGALDAQITVLHADGRRVEMKKASKMELARWLVRLATSSR
ncbi:MAG: phosphopantothenoylcysteine decarboxylase [Planctomycetes bacterium]|nr:phosphopantothenoylcysteine decarboxylase [Planctomycetota bacterium]